jgi:hypothetical protein
MRGGASFFDIVKKAIDAAADSAVRRPAFRDGLDYCMKTAAARVIRPISAESLSGT